ncbi:GtrA family protein [Cohnella caldifontis]|uniref:GtrA family protein n=1 Tax=Cohnella caldifontis TaxID=3027471 RepID=UPI0023EC02AE|nr:GtrA family protein [Cohnella sp. YIM B05605]
MWKLGKEHIRMAKFALVGVLNTGVDFAVFIVLVYGLGLNSALAQVISYCCGVANSYALNRIWTFRGAARGGFGEILRFLLVNGASFGAATAVLIGLLDGAGWPAYAAKLVSVLAAMAVNYAGTRLWVFRMEKDRQGAQ